MSPLPFVPFETVGLAALIAFVLLGMAVFAWLAYACRRI